MGTLDTYYIQVPFRGSGLHWHKLLTSRYLFVLLITGTFQPGTVVFNILNSVQYANCCITCFNPLRPYVCMCVQVCVCVCIYASVDQYAIFTRCTQMPGINPLITCFKIPLHVHVYLYIQVWTITCFNRSHTHMYIYIWQCSPSHRCTILLSHQTELGNVLSIQSFS